MLVALVTCPVRVDRIPTDKALARPSLGDSGAGVAWRGLSNGRRSHARKWGGRKGRR